MQHAVEEIGAMTKSLEESGFERRQADATVTAIANSIEKFAVTPQVLREAFDELRSEMRVLIGEQTEAMNARFKDQVAVINARFEDHRADINARFEDQRADSNARFEQQRAETNARFADMRSDMNKQFEALRAELRADTSRLFTLTLSIAVGMAGVAGALIFERLL